MEWKYTSNSHTTADALNELAFQAKSGDQRALSGLLTHPDVRRPVLAIACQMLGATEAEDVYQDVCMSVSLKLYTWQGTGKVANWIRRITVHRCYDRQQRHKREYQAHQDMTAISDMQRDGTPPQIKRLLSDEKTTLLETALNNMGAQCRQMLGLYIFDCLDKPTIMRTLGLKKTKFYYTWSHCYHALMRKIQKFLKKTEHVKTSAVFFDRMRCFICGSPTKDETGHRPKTRRVTDQRRDGSPTRLYREKAVYNHLQRHCHRMQTPINVYILEKYTCLEPQVGEELLPLYPDFLSDAQKASFELHVEGCEFCQERWKLWKATGLALRGEGLLSRAQSLLRQGQYSEAISWYNKALAIAPDVFETPEGQAFFLNDAWVPLTSARSKARDISLFVVPNHDPGAQALVAASVVSAFPITLDFAHGTVMLKLFALGRFIFAELLTMGQEFATGVQLVGQEAQRSGSLCTWTIRPGTKQRLGTLATLFGSMELADIARIIRTFRVFPL